MRWFKASLLFLFVSPALAVEDYILGGGAESDSTDGLSGVVFTDVGLTDKTRVSASLGKSAVSLPNGIDLNTAYGDVGFEHWFDPVGIRMEVAYWGDADIFDSLDGRGSFYWRNDKTTLAANMEYRDFEFDIFRNDVLPGQDVRFHAKGIGASANFRLSDVVSLSLRGMDYNYNVDLRLDSNRRIIELLSISRLSLINSLVDYRVSAGLGLDVGKRRWDFTYLTLRGEVDGSTTHSATVHFLTSMGGRSDIQFGLGVDDSDVYGSVTFFSVFLYFYGGS